MTTKLVAVLSIVAVSLSPALGQLSSCPQPKFNYLPPNVLPGFSLTKLTDNLTHPRQVALDAAQNLVIASLGDGLVGLKVAYDSAGCPSVAQKTIIVPDNGRNFTHAVIFSNDKKTLFASTPNYVYAWSYNATSMSVTSAARVIVKGMIITEPTMSITRAMGISQEYSNMLMVFRGETNSTDPRLANPANGYAQIKYFDWTQAPSGGYDFVTAGGIFAIGVRDSLDFVEDKYGIFWDVDNGLDGDVTRAGQPIGLPGSTNPADELNRLGMFCPGQTPPNLGFPNCQPVWNASAVPNNTLNLHIGQTFSTNPNISDAQCNALTIPPRLSIVPHSAPLGLSFYDPKTASLGEYLRGSAFMAYHGPAGRKIVLAPFNNGNVSAPPSSAENVFDFIWTDSSINKTNCVSELNKGPTAVGCIAPVGLAVNDGGVLYWTSDQTGEVFAVTKQN